MAFGSYCLRVWMLLCPVLFLFVGVVVSDDDFYGVLGVNRDANGDDIRRAYRRLAREWHPDKNTDSNAQEKFIKINEAYETLSDPKKRDDYDRYGPSGAPNHWEREHQFFEDSGFMFFNGMPFQFRSNWRNKDFTTLNYFRKTILPESFKKPYLIQIVSDWCINCAAVEEIWESTSRELRSLGLGTSRVDRNMEPQLVKELGVRKLPDFVGVISGRLYHYSGTISKEKLKDFIDGLFPKNLVPEVTNATFESFLHRWFDNKPRGLLFTTKSAAPLLLKIVTFKYRDNVGVGFLQITKQANDKIREKFGAGKYEPSFAIFKENVSNPEVLVKGSELRTGTLDEVISENLYLNLPRLSSQAMLDKLCPQERSLSLRSLCVILFTNNVSQVLQGHRILKMSTNRTWLSKKIRFVYVNERTQQPFAASIKMTEKTRNICPNKKIAKKIAILWHVKNREVKYSWFEGGWCIAKDASRLETVLNKIQSGEIKLELNAVVAELNDEHGKSLSVQLFDLWDNVMYYLFHHVNWSGSLTSLSLVVTFGFVFIVSCLFPSLSDKESDLKNSGEHQQDGSTDVFGLVQLNSQSQNKLIHKGKQGQLVVVLLSDATSKEQATRSPIVQTFAKIARLYSRFVTYNSFKVNLLHLNKFSSAKQFGRSNIEKSLVVTFIFCLYFLLFFAFQLLLHGGKPALGLCPKMEGWLYLSQ